MAAKKSNAKTTSTATVAQPKVAKTKGRKFAGNWNDIPSSRMLLGLVIRAYEAGHDTVSIPVTREAAMAALGYDKTEAA